jgi:hypothetical protein
LRVREHDNQWFNSLILYDLSHFPKIHPGKWNYVPSMQV